MPTAEVNGTTIYYETRGNGPPLVLIPGGTGDGGFFAGILDRLAGEFEVITYDRRSNSRSPRPDGWRNTSIQQQTDDLVALLAALGTGPAIVMGSSAGGVQLVDQAVRRPHTIELAVFHEPAFVGVDQAQSAGHARMAQAVDTALHSAHPEQAIPAFYDAVGGDNLWDRADEGYRRRAVANWEVLFTVEFESFTRYAPSLDDLGNLVPPAIVAAGIVNRPETSPGHHLYLGARWLADRLHTDVLDFPGGHFGFVSDPEEFADALASAIGSARATRATS